jgi:hypothetical protein
MPKPPIPETHRKKAGRKSVWQPIYLIRIYRMARLGLTDDEIVKSLKISRMTLHRWTKEKPELKEALGMARQELSDGESFPHWIYDRLSPDLKKIWDKIRQWDKEECGVNKIELMLQDAGKHVRQQLFLHALCVGRFNPSYAMRKVNITKQELDSWIEQDVGFAELVQEIDFHKGNFFESSLVGLVKKGDTGATIFANKTYNSSRGYGTKTQLDVNVSGQIMHGVVDLSEIMSYLSEASKLELLTAIRKKDEKENPRLTVVEKLSQSIADSVGEEA